MNQTACPACGTILELDPRFPPWCEECGWGVEPLPEDSAGEGRVLRWWRRRLNAVSAKEHERLLRDGLEARPGKDHFVVLLLAAAVHVVTAVVAVLLLLVLLSGLPVWAKAVLGLLLAGLLWEIGPRPRRYEPSGFELSRSAAPHLHALVDQVASVLGVKPPSRVLVDEHVNASWGVQGLRRQRVLTLGLPLWAALDAQGKVALLGHELGHEASGDLRRGWFVGTALDSLSTWRELLTPVVDDPVDSGWNPAGIVVYVAQWVAVIALAPVVAALFALEVGLGTLALRSGQRSEHAADRLGATVAGKGPAIDSEQLLLHTEALDLAVSVAARQDRGADVWGVARGFVATVPEHEHRRQMRRAAETLQAVDDSHPPTTRRLQLLATAPDAAALVTLAPDVEQRIDEEVRSAESWVTRRLRDRATYG